MYACSPKWRKDWIGTKDLREVLTQLAKTINKRYLLEFGRVGINYGLHFTGGEPFLNFELLVEATQIASELEIPAMFAETNCFWCVNDEDTEKRLAQLKEAGLNGILVSVNPFILEYVPFERTERAIRISREIFRENLLVYQESFQRQFRRLNLRNTLSLEDYFSRVGPEGLRFVELIPMGRAPYKLGHLHLKYPSGKFFGESCREELTRDWHVHVDNYCNYVPGYCGGISLGDARKLESICKGGVNLDDRLIIKALVSDMKELYDLAVREYNYKELPEGYISKCHLCVDVRRHLAKETGEFEELQPREFYNRLE